MMHTLALNRKLANRACGHARGKQNAQRSSLEDLPSVKSAKLIS